MEIYLDSNAIRQIRLAALDAIEDGDTETLREELIEAFTDADIEEIERRVDAVDFFDFISDILEEWGGDDVDELFEVLEGQLTDADVDLKYAGETEEAGDDDEEEDAGDTAAAGDDDEEDEDEDEDEEDAEEGEEAAF
ncbi:MAG: hypothetical protein GW913_12720 [Myxococcales bacterium]|nr:hypothetical protein [Myxococcales bacterium]